MQNKQAQEEVWSNRVNKTQIVMQWVNSATMQIQLVWMDFYTQKIPNQPLHALHCHSVVITLVCNFLKHGPSSKMQKTPNTCAMQPNHNRKQYCAFSNALGYFSVLCCEVNKQRNYVVHLIFFCFLNFHEVVMLKMRVHAHKNI